MSSIKLTSSALMKNLKENIIFQEISTKWDSSFGDENLNENQKPKSNNTNNYVTWQTLSHPNRKSKNRSIYGQPQINLDQQPLNNPIQQMICWKSLDSLEYCESNHSFGSNSTSLSDLRTLDYQQRTQDLIVSDLGTSVESFEQEPDKEQRCLSVNSTSSGCSVADIQEELTSEERNFMKRFVEKIFADSLSISLEEKSEFGHHVRTDAARIWFARYINKKRNENKCVKESTFYSLAQYFAIVLFECAESDDFTPAKILMNMSFTYYHHNQTKTGQNGWTMQRSLDRTVNNKQYLYTVLRDQPIWKLPRFWNAAFFDAIQCERENFYENRLQKPKLSKTDGRQQSEHDRYYDWQFHANLTFGQLGTFTYNMHSFGLPKEFCLDFLRKQSTIANLTNDQIQLLQDNIESMYQ